MFSLIYCRCSAQYSPCWARAVWGHCTMFSLLLNLLLSWSLISWMRSSIWDHRPWQEVLQSLFLEMRGSVDWHFSQSYGVQIGRTCLWACIVFWISWRHNQWIILVGRFCCRKCFSVVQIQLSDLYIAVPFVWSQKDLFIDNVGPLEMAVR